MLKFLSDPDIWCCFAAVPKWPLQGAETWVSMGILGCPGINNPFLASHMWSRGEQSNMSGINVAARAAGMEYNIGAPLQISLDSLLSLFFTQRLVDLHVTCLGSQTSSDSSVAWVLKELNYRVLPGGGTILILLMEGLCTHRERLTYSVLVFASLQASSNSWKWAVTLPLQLPHKKHFTSHLKHTHNHRKKELLLWDTNSAPP